MVNIGLFQNKKGRKIRITISLNLFYHLQISKIPRSTSDFRTEYFVQSSEDGWISYTVQYLIQYITYPSIRSYFISFSALLVFHWNSISHRIVSGFDVTSKRMFIFFFSRILLKQIHHPLFFPVELNLRFFRVSGDSGQKNSCI